MSYEPADIRTRVLATGALPTLPGVVRKLMTIVDDQNVSMQEISRIISSDQVISSRLLRIVNSAFYGFPGRITTISHALVLLGFNVVKGLVVTASVIDMMTATMVGLWEHSLGTAVACGCVARHIKERDPEEALVAGLLHDLGKVILSVKLKDVCRQVEAARDERGLRFFDAERAVMGGIAHPDIGDWVSKEWNLPIRLREAIAHHHHPSRAEFEPRLTAIVHLGNIICHGLNFGFAGDRQIPPFDPATLRILDLKQDDLVAIIHATEKKLEETDCSELTG